MLILFATILIDLIGLGIIIPILPFLAPELGASNFDIAMIIGIYSVFAGVLSPLWGRLSDHWGRKPVLLFCLAGVSVSYVLLAFADTLLMLYLSRILAGAMAGNFGVVTAMIADMTKPEERAKYMGMVGAMFGIGLVIGPFLGGVLAGDDGNFMLPSFLAAAMSFAALLAALFFLPESLSRETRAEHASHRATHGNGGSTLKMLRDTGNTMLALQFLLAAACHTSASYIFPLWVGANLGWGAKEVGMVFGGVGLAMAFMQAGLIGRLVRAFGELRVLFGGSAVLILGTLIAASANTEFWAVAGFCIAIGGATACNPVLNTLVANRTPHHLRGRVLGTTSASGAFGRVCGPIVGGALLTLGNFHIAWLGATAAAFGIAAFAFVELKKQASQAGLETLATEEATATGDINGA